MPMVMLRVSLMETRPQSVSMTTTSSSSARTSPNVAVTPETLPEAKMAAKKQAPNNIFPAGRDTKVLTHFYIAIDLRTIKLTTAAITMDTCEILFEPFYLQFSYAFFGITEPIKTYPAVRFERTDVRKSLTIPHGFCGFNFATTLEKLHYSFTSVPLIVQLVSARNDTLLGTSEIDLSCLLTRPTTSTSGASTSSGPLSDNFVNFEVAVRDELNEAICTVQVVMFLQEVQLALGQTEEIDARLVELSKATNVGDKDGQGLFKELNEMILETVQDVDIWKEQQLTQFKGKLKQKEAEFLAQIEDRNKKEMTTRLNSIKELETKLKVSMEVVAEREAKVLMREKEMGAKAARITSEVEEAVRNVRQEFETKLASERGKVKQMEVERGRHVEKVYQMERKLKEKDFKIKELETQLAEMSKKKIGTQRAVSLNRAQAGGTLTRRIVTNKENE